MDELAEPLEDRKFEKGFMVFGAIVSLLIGIGVLIFFISKVSESHSIPTKGQVLDLAHFGAFGDFIAGVVGTFFSLAGFFLLYLTLKDQRENFHKERLESNFFEMIKFHRENVNEMQFSYYENKEEKVTAEKRKVFKIIFSHFKEAWFELNHIFDSSSINDIYEDKYLASVSSNPQISSRKIDVKQFAQVDISYLIIFFGLSREDKQTILNLCYNRYKIDFVVKVLEFASLKPKRESDHWITWERIMMYKERYQIFEDILNRRKDENYQPKIEVNWHVEGDKWYMFKPFYPDNYNKYYGGHQFRLGHYYRHIFQTVKFIDKEKYLTENEKYDYIKILRGQLSNYEQLVFFLNSLSEIGRTWELMKKHKPDKEIKKVKQLITKYNLIKNIPMQYVVGAINLLDYYPEIEYEAIAT
jgi:hypothetical protein